MSTLLKKKVFLPSRRLRNKFTRVHNFGFKISLNKIVEFIMTQRKAKNRNNIGKKMLGV